MEEKELILQLVKYYAPKTYDDAAFMQYLSERIDSYFDYFFFRGMEETIKWKVDDCLQSARDDYIFMSDPSHPVSLAPEEKIMRFGKYTVPAYWYTLWAALILKKKKVEDLSDRQKQTLKRILGEPGSILPDGE